MEVETDFTIVKYRPAPGSDLKDAFVAKGDGLPRQSFYDVTLEGEFVNDEKYGCCEKVCHRRQADQGECAWLSRFRRH